MESFSLFSADWAFSLYQNSASERIRAASCCHGRRELRRPSSDRHRLSWQQIIRYQTTQWASGWSSCSSCWRWILLICSNVSSSPVELPDGREGVRSPWALPCSHHAGVAELSLHVWQRGLTSPTRVRRLFHIISFLWTPGFCKIQLPGFICKEGLLHGVEVTSSSSGSSIWYPVWQDYYFQKFIIIMPAIMVEFSRDLLPENVLPHGFLLGVRWPAFFSWNYYRKS